MSVHVMIMAGGSGARFWPRSRLRTPKQLLNVLGERSMLQQTVTRVLPLAPASLLVVTNAAQAAPSQRQLDALEMEVEARVVAEPRGRNTAPAVALGAALLARDDPDGVMIVLPADHHIALGDAFRALLSRAVEVARGGALVTLGITPTRPETGYGYIERGEAVAPDVSRVAGFREKPDRETAERYLAGGEHLWNSGMFIWTIASIRAALARHMPALSAHVERIITTPEDALGTQIEVMFDEVEAQSIDYGVMEKHDDVAVLPADIGWSDVGSWASLWELLPHDERDNASEGDTIVVDSDGCLVHSSGRTVAIVGVQDLVVVETDDAVLVCPRERSQDVRDIVQTLRRRDQEDLL